MASTRNKNLYNDYDIRRYVDDRNFSVIMDTANAKYNSTSSREAMWRILGDWDKPTDSRVWSQGQKTIPIMARASLLSTHGLKPTRNTSGWKFYTGSTPKFGHGYTMDEDDMFMLRDVRNNTGAPMQNLIYDSLLTNAQNILGGMHNELTHMCLELASTSEIHEQSVDGIAYDFTFDFEQSQFFEAAPVWFNPDGTPNESATVLEDILSVQRSLRSVQARDVDAWMLNKDTFDKILSHPSVRNSYLAWRGIDKDNADKYVSINSEISAFLHNRGVWQFLPVDFQSAHEEDGKPVADPPAFSPFNLVAFSTAEKLFNIKCTNSIWRERQRYGGIGANTMYSFVEDRIAVLSTWQENPIHNNVEFELYAGPVFNNLRNYGLFTVWEGK